MPLVQHCRKVTKAVLGLAAALSRLADKHGSGGAALAAAAPWPQPSHAQLLAASLALAQCARLGMRMAVSANDAARIAAAVQLVLRASPHALAAGIAALASSGMQPDGCMGAFSVCYYCSGYAAALHAVCELLAAAPRYQQAAAAFASSTARPEALLPFLREMAQTLLALTSEYADDEGECTGNVEAKTRLLAQRAHYSQMRSTECDSYAGSTWLHLAVCQLCGAPPSPPPPCLS